jgi:ribonuclease P protein component
MNFDFKKTFRLLKQLEFQTTLAKGVKVVSPSLVLYGQKTAVEKPARLGLIVSRKVGKSVERNRVKRSLRENFRLKKANYDGIDIVVIARHSAARVSNLDLTNSFNYCLGRLRNQVHAK